MEEFLIKARKLAYDEVEKTGMPCRAHVDLSAEVGKELAKKMGAGIDIVEAGTLLMDCAIGEAFKQNKLSEHQKMSVDKANELLEDSSLLESEKENIRHCILEHHGGNKFYSLESEICCNADCYRFASIKGVALAIRNWRDMPFGDLIKLLNEKLKEKWNAISIDAVRKELAPQHELIAQMMSSLLAEKNN